ncbi:hypothetical protein SAMN04487844_112138 [Methylobacterium sp. yr596]|nr:hypothetical protein SAMN04487844_112138 [Methylobacterium sp. yr596]
MFQAAERPTFTAVCVVPTLAAVPMNSDMSRKLCISTEAGPHQELCLHYCL